MGRDCPVKPVIRQQLPLASNINIIGKES